MLATLMIPLAFMRTHGETQARRRLFASDAWRNASFSLFGLALFLGYAGLYIPFFYVERYTLERQIIPNGSEYYLLVLLNLGSFFGRLAGHQVSFYDFTH